MAETKTFRIRPVTFTTVKSFDESIKRTVTHKGVAPVRLSEVVFQLNNALAYTPLNVEAYGSDAVGLAGQVMERIYAFDPKTKIKPKYEIVPKTDRDGKVKKGRFIQKLSFTLPMDMRL